MSIPNRTPILEVAHYEKHYGKKLAVRDLSLTV